AASAIASRERRPLESVIRASIACPAARRSRTPATSIRVYLNVGRPRHTAGAETTNFPRGMYSYHSPPTISRISCCFIGNSLPEATWHNQRRVFLLSYHASGLAALGSNRASELRPTSS